jgi:hypothetical protein
MIKTKTGIFRGWGGLVLQPMLYAHAAHNYQSETFLVSISNVYLHFANFITDLYILLFLSSGKELLWVPIVGWMVGLLVEKSVENLL